jgi:hypothetical protein
VIGITDGTPDIALETLHELLANALLDGAVLFVVPAAECEGATRGYAFLLEDNTVEGLSAADAAAAFDDEAPEEWTAMPGNWDDAPPLEYDPAAQ